jgi:hypothetical protein
MLTFYHGSQVSVPQPDAKAGRKNLDFGPGFYLTKIREQAESWAVVMAGRKGRNAQPVLNTYHFDMDRAIADGIRIKSFPAYDLEWLDYVVDCRRGKDVSDDFDIVEGGIANDNGIITAEQALGQLRYKKVNHQLCILSQAVIDKYLTFVESSVLESEEDEP